MRDRLAMDFACDRVAVVVADQPEGAGCTVRGHHDIDGQ